MTTSSQTTGRLRWTGTHRPTFGGSGFLCVCGQYEKVRLRVYGELCARTMSTINARWGMKG